MKRPRNTLARGARRQRQRHFPRRVVAEPLEPRRLLTVDSTGGYQAADWGAVPAAVLEDPSIEEVRWAGRDGYRFRNEWIAGFDSSWNEQQVFDAVAAADASLREDSTGRVGPLPYRQPAVKLNRHLGVATTVSLTTRDDVEFEQLWKALSRRGGIRYVEPNFVVWPTAIPDDADFSHLWGLNNEGQSGGTHDADIDAAEAWDISTGGGSVVVGIIDTGVDYQHPDLRDNIWVNPAECPGGTCVEDGVDNDGNGYVDDFHGYDFINDDPDPFDDNKHGTHVAGTIGAVGNNGIGIAGVNWNVQIMALKFLNVFGSTEDAISCVNYATMMKRDFGVNVRVTNNSWGGGLFSQGLYDAIEASGAQDQLFVAAAGNDGNDTDGWESYPSGYDLENVVAVAATDHDDQLAGFSNYGAATVDLGAPGVDVLSSTPSESYEHFDGTSMATPHVTGAVALIADADPDLTNLEIRDIVYQSVDRLPALNYKTTTGGRLNVHQAMELLGMRVVGTSPGRNQVVTSRLTEFEVRFSDPFTLGTLQASDLRVNGMPADSVQNLDNESARFTFDQSPITAEGAQTIEIAEGAVSSLERGPISAHSATFRYDAILMDVVATQPPEDSLAQLPLSTIRFTMNEPVDADTVDVGDLLVPHGRVIAATAVGPDQVEFTLADLNVEGPFRLTLPAGGLTDRFGNANLPFAGEIHLDFDVVDFPTPLIPVGDGTLIREGRRAGTIGVADDVDGFVIRLDAGQTVSAVLATSPQLRGRLELFGPDDELIAAGSAGAPGGAAMLPTSGVVDAGSYRLQVSGSAGTSGGYELTLLLNASIESENHDGATNDDLQSAQELSDSFISLGEARRGAVVGRLPSSIGPLLTSENFESGRLTAAWDTWTEPGGAARVADDDAADGAYSLIMDGEDFGFSLIGTAATWTVDLSDTTDATLRFRHRAWQDWPDPLPDSFQGDVAGDGVAISADGVNFFTVLNAPQPPDGAWTEYSIDLGQAAEEAGIALGDDFRIRFAQADYWRIPFGGRAWDDLRIFRPSTEPGDWYRFDLEDGSSATLSARVIGATGKLTIDLFDDQGNRLATGANDGSRAQSIAGFVDATSDGGPDAYFVRVTGFDARYVLSVIENGDADREPNDGSRSDSQQLLGAGTVLGFVTSGADPISEESEPNDDGVPGASIDDFLLADDLSGSFTSAGDRRHEATVTGEIETGGDGDWDFLRIRARPGDVLEVEMLGLLSDAGTLFDPYLRLFDDRGTEIAFNDDYFTYDSFLTYSNFAYEGDYYIVADSYGAESGTYTLTATLLSDADLRSRDQDSFSFTVEDGRELAIWTETPFDGPGEVSNSLDPRLELFDGAGQLVAMDEDGSGDGRNAAILHDASAGDYTVRVLTDDGAGEYLLRLGDVTRPLPSFQVKDPEQYFVSAPARWRVDFNQPILLSTVDAGDLLIDGQPSVGVTVVDGDTLSFELPPLSDGTHSLTLHPGVLRSVAGFPLQSFSGQLRIDGVGPVVVSSSVSQGDTLAAPTITLDFRFDEPLRETAGLGPESVELVGLRSGERFTPDEFRYQSRGYTLTLVYDDLPEDEYTLTLLSGEGGFEDLVGNDLDGESPGGEIPPGRSGDGTAGGDFVLSFRVDVDVMPLPAPQRARPLGSLLATSLDHAGILDEAGDIDRYRLFASAGETLTARLTSSPGSGAVALAIDGMFEATSTPGGSVVSPPLVLDQSRHWELIVSGDEGAEYVLDVVLNGAYESADSAIGRELDITGSRTDTSARRYAVVGQASRRIVQTGVEVYGVQPASRSIVRLDVFRDRQTGAIPAPAMNSSDTEIGLAVGADGSELLYLNSDREDLLYRLDMSDGRVLETAPLPTGGYDGLGFESGDEATVLYSADMSSDPGWTFDGGPGGWEYGIPTGNDGDPSSGFTGTHVVGYNLNGAYEDGMSASHATTPAFSTTGFNGVTLTFHRWLGVEESYFDEAAIEVSVDGQSWRSVWQHQSDVIDDRWVRQSVDLSAVADDQPTVFVRWRLGPTDELINYAGWNIDDVAVTGRRGRVDVLYSADMSVDPGWTFDGPPDGWQYGIPSGAGGDPASGFTGSHVVGYNLDGPYDNDLPATHATTPAFSTEGYQTVRLSYQRWLGVEDPIFDEAAIEASSDGQSWFTVWESQADVLDDDWVLESFDISAVADQPTVYLRWRLGPTDIEVAYAGWNIDDVVVTGRRGESEVIYSADMSTNPGWTLQGGSTGWRYGVPAGNDGDPTSGFTGNQVMGFNLNGAYRDNLSPTYATTPAIDASDTTSVVLSFYRWLGIEDSFYDGATIEVSNDSVNWTTVWNHTGTDLVDTSWTPQRIDISDVAADQPRVHVRWGMGPTDESVNFAGWNIDDVRLIAVKKRGDAVLLNRDNDGVWKRDGFGGSLASHYSLVPTSNAVGADGQGRAFVFSPSEGIVEFDPLEPDVTLAVLPAPADDVEGMAFDGRLLYASTRSGHLFVLDPDDGDILSRSAVQGGPLLGLAARRVSTDETLVLPDVDLYTIDLTGAAGRTIDVALTGLRDSFADQTLELLAPDGQTVLATGAPSPRGVETTNVDLSLHGFVVPDDGVYTLRVSSFVDGPYSVVVVQGMALESEPNDDASAPLRSLDTVAGSLGYLDVDGDSADHHVLNLERGERVRVWTETPLDDASRLPVNDLGTRLVVLAPDGSTTADDQGSLPDGRNSEVSFVASVAGRYVVRVTAASGEGEYALRYEMSETTLTVASVEVNGSLIDPPNLPGGAQPTSWTVQRSSIRTIDIRFSRSVTATAADFRLVNRGVGSDEHVEITIDAGQLQIDGEVVTIGFSDDRRLADGVYRLTVLATVTDLDDGTTLDGDADGIPGGDHVLLGDADNGFYQLTGDFNGDAGTSIFDFHTFVYWFGRSTQDIGGPAPTYVDLHRDMGVSIFDFQTFASNFGGAIEFAPGLFPAGAKEGEEPEPPVESHERIVARHAFHPLVDWRIRRPSAKAARSDAVESESSPAELEDLLDLLAADVA